MSRWMVLSFLFVAACSSSEERPSPSKNDGGAKTATANDSQADPVPTPVATPADDPTCPEKLPALGTACDHCSTEGSTGGPTCPKCFYSDQPTNPEWPYGEDRVCCGGVWHGIRGGAGDLTTCANVP